MRETWNNAREYKYTAKKLNSKNNLVNYNYYTKTL